MHQFPFFPPRRYDYDNYEPEEPEMDGRCTVFVGNIPYDTCWRHLKEFFSQLFGDVRYVKLNNHVITRRFLGEDSATEARSELMSNGVRFCGRWLRGGYPRPRDNFFEDEGVHDYPELQLQLNLEGDSDYSPISWLNDDCLAHILSFVDPVNRFKVERVSTTWQRCALQASSQQRYMEVRNPSGLLFGTRLSESRLCQLISRNSNNLVTLDLSLVPSKVNKSAVETIGFCCQKLQRLDISGAYVSNIGMARIAESCSGLKWLRLEGCPRITEKGFWSIFKYCLQLESLLCYANRFSGNCFKIAPKSLKEVHLRNCLMEGEVDYSSTLSLSEFMAMQHRASEKGVLYLSLRCTNLTTLNLHNCKLPVWHGVADVLKKCRKLEDINIGHMDYKTFPAMTPAPKHPVWSLAEPSIVTRLMVDNIRVKDEDLQFICNKLVNLKELDISCSFLHDCSVSQLSNLQHLEMLHICHLFEITNSSLTDLVTRGKLKLLQMQGCKLITDELFELMALSCTQLEELDIAGVVHATPRTVFAFNKMMEDQLDRKLTIFAFDNAFLDDGNNWPPCPANVSICVVYRRLYASHNRWVVEADGDPSNILVNRPWDDYVMNPEDYEQFEPYEEPEFPVLGWVQEEPIEFMGYYPPVAGIDANAFAQPQHQQLPYPGPQYGQHHYQLPQAGLQYQQPYYQQLYCQQHQYPNLQYQQLQHPEPLFQQPQYQQLQFQQQQFQQLQLQQLQYQHLQHHQMQPQALYPGPQYHQLQYGQPQHQQLQYGQPQYQELQYVQPEYPGPQSHQAQYEQPHNQRQYRRQQRDHQRHHREHQREQQFRRNQQPQMQYPPQPKPQHRRQQYQHQQEYQPHNQEQQPPPHQRPNQQQPQYQQPHHQRLQQQHRADISPLNQKDPHVAANRKYSVWDDERFVTLVTRPQVRTGDASTSSANALNIPSENNRGISLETSAASREMSSVAKESSSLVHEQGASSGEAFGRGANPHKAQLTIKPRVVLLPLLSSTSTNGLLNRRTVASAHKPDTTAGETRISRVDDCSISTVNQPGTLSSVGESGLCNIASASTRNPSTSPKKSNVENELKGNNIPGKGFGTLMNELHITVDNSECSSRKERRKKKSKKSKSISPNQPSVQSERPSSSLGATGELLNPDAENPSGVDNKNPIWSTGQSGDSFLDNPTTTRRQSDDVESIKLDVTSFIGVPAEMEDWDDMDYFPDDQDYDEFLENDDPLAQERWNYS